jgi:hypothetical protein
MKRSSDAVYRMIAFIMITVLALSGCSQAVPENADRIMSPTIRDVPFAGTWVLKKCPSEGAMAAADDIDPMEGDTVAFSQSTLMFENKIYKDIRYKVKRVDVYAYFLHKKTGLPEGLDRGSSEITVTSVYSQDNFLFEFIEDTGGKKIAVIDDRYYRMEKISDEFSNELKTASDEDEKNGLDESAIRGERLRSGLLLGVRIPVNTADGLGDYKYGTYWIPSDNLRIGQVLYADDIYLPRMDGFWKLIVEKRPGLYGLEDTLVAYKVSNKQVLAPDEIFRNMSGRIETKVRKAIVYVGNDYVCVENTVYGSRDDAAGDPDDTAPEMEEKTLRTLPVDNLTNIDGIKISDMAGENGTMAMQNAISEVLKTSGYEGVIVFDDEEQEKNFALYRKTGHWFFKGRIDPDGKGQLPYMDFSLNLLPPSNMVAYDVLHVPWTDMKDKLPHAIDIYTSPNKDIAVILTRSEILAYTIHGRRLSDDPIAKFKLEDGSSVIMAEWGMGNYTASWEKSFVRNNKTKEVENLLDPQTAKSQVPSD